MYQSDPCLAGSYLFPASSSQERLWFLHEFDDTGGAAYHLHGAFHVTGTIDRLLLQRALNHVVARHESLRTRFTHVDGHLTQVVSPDARVTVQVEDAGADDVVRRSKDHGRRPFDLTRGPLLRVTLLRLTTGGQVLVLTVHHLVADGWSVSVILRELAACYEAYRCGREPDLPSLPVQAADVAAWQRQWLDSPEGTRAREYWSQQLAGAPTVLDLPTDRPRPRVQSFRGAVHPFRLGPDLTRKLHALARDQDATLFMTLLAGAQILLGRYTGQRDFLLGMPVANRSHAETEGLVGFLANTLVIRADLSGDPTREELLDRVRRVCLDAYEHQGLPFEEVVRELRPTRTPSMSPVFQVLFGEHDLPQRPFEFSDLVLDPLPPAGEAAKFDLSFFVSEQGDEVSGIVEYRSDLFDEPTVVGLVERYVLLLEHLAEAPGQRVARLSLGQVDIGDTRPRQDPGGQSLPAMFAAQVASTPGRIALVQDPARLTYAELAARAGAVTALLRARGIGRGDRVAVCLGRTPDLVVVLLGVLGAGAAYVPVDPGYPAERLTFMLDDAAPHAVVTDRENADLVQGLAPTLTLDAVNEVSSHVGTPAEVAPGDLAYLLFTSGSTGRPKGVMVSHGALSGFLRCMATKPGLGEEDILAAITTVSFDISVLELFLPLVSGASLVLVPETTARDGAALREALDQHGVTVLQATPATWRLLLDAGWRPGPGLRMLCGGEALAPDLAGALTAPGAAAAWNLYGPTEATVWAFRKHLEPGGAVTIGRPLENTVAHILDPDLRPVPAGLSGELFLGGHGLADGYWRRPGLTAARFVPDPYRPGARLYRTGDLVRRPHDGDLEFLGRTDAQVKIRGFRVEPGEVEVLLRGHPRVCEAVVVARGRNDAERHLVAFVVPDSAGPTENLMEELRERARLGLPDHMRPTRYAVMDVLPRTPNGKVDRSALPEPPLNPPLRGRVPPRTTVERKVAAIWGRVLGLEDVGVYEDFFEAGGNSLLAARLAREVEDELGVPFAVRDLFIDPTVAHVAAVIEAATVTIGPNEADGRIRQLVAGLPDEAVEALLADLCPGGE